ncbi:HAD family phosphatase [Horticoccus luteus]|uniref:HAD family phosphatase n=1 Tax=Horticoccus luteus TaxID=2862869 RepID=A0A8F9U017_9BACT|nr:HAD family phosphatase [Horticoccus luteus]QYM80657.1 HAD family phosphatase [Horticoccus luteus]
MANVSPDLGVIFDWDGVIIDSSHHHELSWERLAAEERRTLPEGHFKLGFGKKNEWIIPELLGWTRDSGDVRRLSLRKEALYREIVAERGLEVLPGGREFLARLAEGRVPFCVGSSTHRENIATILDVLGLASVFTAMVTAEDVTQGKPHPDVFLRAAEKISRAPASCVVFEDAFAGIEAARAGGMKVVGVATTHPAEALRGRVDRVVHRLDELTVADLHKLVAR